jgi:hypothetical protein
MIASVVFSGRPVTATTCPEISGCSWKSSGIWAAPRSASGDAGSILVQGGQIGLRSGNPAARARRSRSPILLSLLVLKGGSASGTAAFYPRSAAGLSPVVGRRGHTLATA